MRDLIRRELQAIWDTIWEFWTGVPTEIERKDPPFRGERLLEAACLVLTVALIAGFIWWRNW
jgi:hypothetical protein